MSNVDFSQSNAAPGSGQGSDKKGGRKKGKKYAIEYTNPDVQEAPTTSRPQRKSGVLASIFGKKNSAPADQTHIKAESQSAANSEPVTPFSMPATGTSSNNMSTDKAPSGIVGEALGKRAAGPKLAPSLPSSETASSPTETPSQVAPVVEVAGKSAANLPTIETAKESTPDTTVMAKAKQPTPAPRVAPEMTNPAAAKKTDTAPVVPTQKTAPVIVKPPIPAAPKPPEHKKPAPQPSAPSKPAKKVTQPVSVTPAQPTSMQPAVVKSPAPVVADTITEADKVDTSLPQVTAQPITARTIPTPPPPPQHPVVPVTPVQKPAPVVAQAPAMPTAPPETPVVTQKVVTQPTITAAAASGPAEPTATKTAASDMPAPSGAPTQAHHARVEKPGEIYAQRVVDVKGKRTEPNDFNQLTLGVNLVPSLSAFAAGPYAVVYKLLAVTVGALSIVALAYGGLVGAELYYSSQAQSSQNQVGQLDSQIATYTELRNDIRATNTRVATVQSVLDNHVYWTNFFTELEAHTLPNVEYVSFSGTTSGTVTLQATTTDFTSVTRQVGVLQDNPELFSNVNVSSASAPDPTASATPEVSVDEENEEAVEDEDTAEDDTAETDEAANGPISFSITFDVNPDIFYYGTK